HTRWPRDWSSDVCSSDLASPSQVRILDLPPPEVTLGLRICGGSILAVSQDSRLDPAIGGCRRNHGGTPSSTGLVQEHSVGAAVRSEERRVGKGGGGRSQS